MSPMASVNDDNTLHYCKTISVGLLIAYGDMFMVMSSVI